MQTYRYRGHSMSDPAKYRTKDEVQKMREEHDPIEQVQAAPDSRSSWATEDELKTIDDEVRDIVNEAAEFAPDRSRARRRPSSGPTSAASTVRRETGATCRSTS